MSLDRSSRRERDRVAKGRLDEPLRLPLVVIRLRSLIRVVFAQLIEWLQ